MKNLFSETDTIKSHNAILKPQKVISKSYKRMTNHIEKQIVTKHKDLLYIRQLSRSITAYPGGDLCHIKLISISAFKQL